MSEEQNDGQQGKEAAEQALDLNWGSTPAQTQRHDERLVKLEAMLKAQHAQLKDAPGIPKPGAAEEEVGPAGYDMEKRWATPIISTCANCGTKIIYDCGTCGAPNCCPKCCAELAEYARKMDLVRLGGRLEAFAMAMTECGKAVPRGEGYVGARDCSEIRKAIDILHLDTLRQIAALSKKLT